MAHPDGARGAPFFPQPSNSGEGSVDVDLGAAELAVVAALDPAAELGAHGLLAVADAEHGHAQLEHPAGARGLSDLGDAGRAAGQDDRLGLEARSSASSAVLKGWISQ